MSGIDWPGLLAWSTQYHDGTSPSEFRVMSDEDREFLEKAMEEAFGKIEDPNQIMAEAIQQLKAPDRTDLSIQTALEVLDKSCDDPDCARNAEKLDGIQPLLDLLGSHSGPLAVRTLEILALLFANNPLLQEVGERRGALGILIKLVREGAVGSDERAKAFRALVALVRQSATCEETFLRREDGVAVLVSCLAPEETMKMWEKAASFTCSLAHDKRLRLEDVQRLSAAVAPLMQDVGAGHVQYRETLASCACALVLVDPAACPPQLSAAANGRLGQLRSSGPKQQDGSDQELTALEEISAACAQNP